MGEYHDVMTKTQPELEKIMLKNTIFFIIEKKDGVKIGHIAGWMIGRTIEMGFALIPRQKGKIWCSGLGLNVGLNYRVQIISPALNLSTHI